MLAIVVKMLVQEVSQECVALVLTSLVRALAKIVLNESQPKEDM